MFCYVHRNAFERSGFDRLSEYLTWKMMWDRTIPWDYTDGVKWSKWYHLQSILRLLYKSTTCSFSLRQFKILVCDVRKRVGGVTRTWEDGWNEYYVFFMFKDRRAKGLLHRKKLKKSIWRRVIEFIEPCKHGRAVWKRELLKRVLQYIYNSLSISWFMTKTKNLKRRELHSDLNTCFLFLPLYQPSNFYVKSCQRW